MNCELSVGSYPMRVYVTVEIQDGNGTGRGAGKDHVARVDGLQREAGHHHC